MCCYHTHFNEIKWSSGLILLLVRGYHVYESVCNAIVGENLPCVVEPSNTADQYAAATMFYLYRINCGR